MIFRILRPVAASLFALASLAAAQDQNPAYPQAQQDHLILLEACGAMKNQKQSDCLDALVRMEELIAQVPPRSPAEIATAKKSFMKKKYAAALRTFAALKTATARQVSLEQYGPMVDAAANEVALLRPRAASDPERQAIRLFDQAIEEYRQAAKNWDAAGKFGLPASSFVVPKWRAARDAVKQAETLLQDAASRP
ncbi:MAG: hypothetical protein HY847_05955 [Betaproteobacteria bacterium]|nr:hypothetical protein [Betaproteobacteria bacterium]